MSSKKSTWQRFTKMERRFNDMDFEYSLMDRNLLSKKDTEFRICVDSAESLLNAYFKVKDRWEGAALNTLDGVMKMNQIKNKLRIRTYLRSFFQLFVHDKEMQQIILSSLNAENPDIDELARIVDERWKVFFPFVDERERNRRDARTVISLLLSGIHFHILQTRGESIALQEPNNKARADVKQLEKSLTDIVDWTFA